MFPGGNETDYLHFAGDTHLTLALTSSLSPQHNIPLFEVVTPTE